MGAGRPRPGVPTIKEPSIKIAEDWVEVDSIDFTTLSKKTTYPPEEGKHVKDVRWAGKLGAFDDDLDRITARTPKRLRTFPDITFPALDVATDPHFRDFAQEGTGNVFVSDSVLVHLMSAPRSQHPWDIEVTRLPGGILIIDARDPNVYDTVTVGENSAVPPPEDPTDPNNREKLAREATAIQRAFTQSVLVAPRADLPEMEANPALEDDSLKGKNLPSVAYRYRRWKVAEGVTVVVRSTVNAVENKEGKPQYVSAFTLSEWESFRPPTTATPPKEWKQIIDTQRMTVFAAEMKSNANKVSKMVMQAILAGADYMRIGFVSRVSKSDTTAHHILGVTKQVPATLASQLKISTANMWAILLWLVRSVREQANADAKAMVAAGSVESEEDVHALKYVLLRDHEKPVLKIFSIPFEADEEE